MMELNIDGRTILAPEGSTVMEAALANGIDIPHLCYHPELSVSGGCRLCLVEVDGQVNPAVSCGLTCSEGMVVRTRTPALLAMRREVLRLLLHRHPLDCMTCEKNGTCLLQKYAYEYQVQPESATPDQVRDGYFDDNPFFVRDLKYCILCGRCVRVCDEVVGAHAIDIAGRGHASRIATALDINLKDTSCVFCGSCVQVCPTAALMPVRRQGAGRAWDLQRTTTICGYCGVGCKVDYALNEEGVVDARGHAGDSVNGEFLCVKGRFGWDFVDHPDRLTRPMIRRDVAYAMGLTDEPWTLPDTSSLTWNPSHLAESHLAVDWDTALDAAAQRLSGVVRTHGPDAVMGLSSARCTNEENYLFQKFMRAAIGTNNVDHCARL